MKYLFLLKGVGSALKFTNVDIYKTDICVLKNL